MVTTRDRMDPELRLRKGHGYQGCAICGDPRHLSPQHEASMKGLRSCSRCRKNKPLDDFGRTTCNPSGHSYECKDCKNKRQRTP